MPFMLLEAVEALACQAPSCGRNQTDGKQDWRKLLENGCAIYIFASNLIIFGLIFKVLISIESWSQLQICQKVAAQLRTMRTQFGRPWTKYRLKIDLPLYIKWVLCGASVFDIFRFGR